jgi:MFS family permease
LKNHSLITTLKNLKGNPRGCVYTEPLWGIPFNLYAPYVSIYMLALGMSDIQIGLILSVSWGLQIVFALLSGVIADKLGRRRTTLIFDILAWTIPSLISALAQNFWYFLAAGMINSVWRITLNSWTCLLVEDADRDQLVDMYTWIYIGNQLVGFVAPLAGVIIGVFSLVPTVRGLYMFAAVMFTLKAVLTYIYTQETAQGIVRMRETRDQSVFGVLGEYSSVVRQLVRAPQTLYTAGIMLVISISALINNTFWGIIVTQKLHVPAQNLALFPFVKSAIILAFFFTIMPRIKRLHYKLPMALGFLGYIASQLVLIAAPELGYSFLVVSLLLEACSYAAVSPLVDQMMALTIDPKERARIQSILYVGIILLTSPFGWIAGTLSGLNKNLPFVLNIALFALGAALAYRAGQAAQKRLAAEATSATSIS